MDPIPHTFADNVRQTASGEQLNDNFATVRAAIDALEATLGGRLDLSALTAALQQAIPKAGDIKLTGVSGADSGWLLCDGAIVSRTTYAALFARIGSTFGAGDGRTTFGLPDLRGRAPVGPDGVAGRLSSLDALGNGGGNELHSHTAGTLTANSHAHGIAADGDHAHSMGIATRGTASNVNSGGLESTAYTNHVHGINNAGTHSHGGGTAGASAAVSGTTANGSTVQPYQIVQFQIKT